MKNKIASFFLIILCLLGGYSVSALPQFLSARDDFNHFYWQGNVSSFVRIYMIQFGYIYCYGRTRAYFICMRGEGIMNVKLALEVPWNNYISLKDKIHIEYGNDSRELENEAIVGTLWDAFAFAGAHAYGEAPIGSYFDISCHTLISWYADQTECVPCD